MTVLLYVAQSLPYHWSSTSMRTHALAQALASHGCTVRVVTQPGYPVRNGGSTRKSGPDMVDGIAYHRLAAVEAAPAIIDHYARQAGVALGRVARTLEADIILAAGDLEAAYPAAIAARMAGAGLVRDCLTLTAPSDGKASSDRDALLRRADDALTAEAELVLTRWPGAADSLTAAGVTPAKLALLAEASPTFTTDEKTPAWRSDPALEGRLVLGYVGDPYEDLDLDGLGDAFEALVAGGSDVALAVFGVGSRFLKLHERLSHRGLGERVLFPGRPRTGAIAEAFAAIDLFVAPTLVDPARSLRTRFELVDALMHDKTVVTTDEPVARAILGDAAVWIGEGSGDLTHALAGLAGDTMLRTARQAATADQAGQWRSLASTKSLVEQLRKGRAVLSS